jgi:hypothetical protein
VGDSMAPSARGAFQENSINMTSFNLPSVFGSSKTNSGGHGVERWLMDVVESDAHDIKQEKHSCGSIESIRDAFEDELVDYDE